MNLSLKPLALSFLTACFCHADLIYDFQGKDATFDGQTSVDVPLSDLGTGNSTTMTVASVGGDLNSNANTFGVDAPGADTNDQIEGSLGESISLTFNSPIELLFLDLSGVGTDINDGAKVTIGAFSIDLFTGVSGFNGSTDLYTPSPSISVPAFTPIVLSASSSTASYTVQQISLRVIPEPSSLALLGLAAVALISRRRFR